jgi:hypothetical protein
MHMMREREGEQIFVYMVSWLVLSSLATEWTTEGGALSGRAACYLQVRNASVPIVGRARLSLWTRAAAFLAGVGRASRAPRALR